MFQFRRSALRLLSSPSPLYTPKVRTLTTFTRTPLRSQIAPVALRLQIRRASGEADAKTGGLPISELQPAPQEEVENAIQSDGLNQAQQSETTSSRSAPPIAETANATEATEEIIPASESKGDQEIGRNAVSGATSQLGGASAQHFVREEMIRTPKEALYIGNLFFDVTEEDLVKEFSRFGKVVKAKIIRDPRGLSKGFGYLDFESTEEAVRAVEEMSNKMFEGRPLTVQFAMYSSKNFPERRTSRPGEGPINPPSKTLFIGNMAFEMTDRDLNNLFRGIRNVVDVRVAIDRRTGQPRGFAHADFIDVKSAQEAMKMLQGKETYGRSLRLDYSYGPSTAPRNTPGFKRRNQESQSEQQPSDHQASEQ